MIAATRDSKWSITRDVRTVLPAPGIPEQNKQEEPVPLTQELNFSSEKSHSPVNGVRRLRISSCFGRKSRGESHCSTSCLYRSFDSRHPCSRDSRAIRSIFWTVPPRLTILFWHSTSEETAFKTSLIESEAFSLECSKSGRICAIFFVSSNVLNW